MAVDRVAQRAIIDPSLKPGDQKTPAAKGAGASIVDPTFKPGDDAAVFKASGKQAAQPAAAAAGGGNQNDKIGYVKI